MRARRAIKIAGRVKLMIRQRSEPRTAMVFRCEVGVHGIDNDCIRRANNTAF
jgi:hypothetical protein